MDGDGHDPAAHLPNRGDGAVGTTRLGEWMKVWILKYYRYKTEQEYEADTKEEALRFGVYGSEYGELSMHELVDPDGKVVMNREQLKDYWFEQEDFE